MSMRYLRRRIGISMLLLLIVLIFAVQNATPVDIQFLRWHFEIRRSVLIATLLFIGCVLGWSARVVYRQMKGPSS